jgi:hypothetical protein
MKNDIINIWSLGHIIVWFILGVFVFKSWKLFIILSILWELLELVLPFGIAKELWLNKITDVVINGIGFAIGINIHTILKTPYK